MSDRHLHRFVYQAGIAIGPCEACGSWECLWANWSKYQGQRDDLDVYVQGLLSHAQAGEEARTERDMLRAQVKRSNEMDSKNDQLRVTLERIAATGCDYDHPPGQSCLSVHHGKLNEWCNPCDAAHTLIGDG